MRMKKSILLSLLAIIALGLGACSNSSNNKQANGQENSAQKKTSQSSSKTKDIATLLEEIETANQKMTSVRQKTNIGGLLGTTDKKIQKEQNMTSQVIYKTEKQEETDNDYVFTLKTQDADILGVYGKEFRFNFSQFPKSNFKKELTVKIDKKSKFLKEFKMNISTSGDQGTLAIKSETSYSDWNLVKKEDIPTISDEKKEQ